MVVWDETVLGVANTYGGTGIQRIFASVCVPRTANFSPICSDPHEFTNVPTDATNAGAVVSPSGTVTVFWNEYNLAPATGSISKFSSFESFNNTWPQINNNWPQPHGEQIPGAPGYTLMAGVYTEVGPSVGVDGNGNIIAVMTNPRTYPLSTGSSFSVKALVRVIAPDGSFSWSKSQLR